MRTLHAVVSQGLRILQQLVFLRYCLIGEHILAREDKLVCTDCLATLPTLHPNYHPHNWASPATSLDQALCYWDFSPELQSLIHEMKYRRKPVIGEILGRYMARQVPEVFTMCTGIIPVPLHATRQRERGYNQSAAIARGIGEVSGVTVEESFLRRRLYTQSQTTLSREERRENLTGVFAVPHKCSGRIRNRSLLLVDDVFTTGATVESAASTLKQAGAAWVGSITLASASLDT